MSTLRTMRLFLRPVLVVVLLLGGCGVDLSVPENVRAPSLLVQVRFLNHQQDVDGHWSADVQSTSPDVPAALQNLPGHAEETLAHQNSVVPNQTVNFPAHQDMRPGTWSIHIMVMSGATRIVDVTCTVTIPAVLGAEVVSLLVIEGGGNCTVPAGGVGPPVTPRRDVALLPFTILANVQQGTQVPINVTALNYGEINENFRIELADTPTSGSPGVILPAQHDVTGLAPNASRQFTSQWNTAGASLGEHELRVAIPALDNETNTANNAEVMTVNIVPAPQHDLEITNVTIPGPVVAGGTYNVDVALRNTGDVEESFTVMLDDTPPGGGPANTIGTSPPLALAASATSTYSFSWNTSGAAAGQHTLTARIPVLASGETNTANNTRTMNVLVARHDVEAISLTAPASAAIGMPVSVTATIRNNGNVNEGNIAVSLNAQPPGGGAPIAIATQNLGLNAGASGTVNFTWNTACLAPAGSYVLSVTAAVANDVNSANNTAAAASTALSVDRELRVAFLNPPASVSQASGAGFIVQLINNNSVAETGIDVSFTDTPVAGPPGAVQRDPRLPVDLACGETKELVFTYFPPSTVIANHTLTATITTVVPGDNPADNSAAVTVSVTP